MPPTETIPPNVALRATLFLDEGVIKAFCTGYGCPTCCLGDGAEVVLAPSEPLRKEYYEVEAASCRDCTRPGGMYRVSLWGKRRVSLVSGETQVIHLVRVHRRSLLEINPDGSSPLSRPASPHTPPTSDPPTYSSGRQSTEPSSPSHLGLPLMKNSGRRRESEPLPTAAPPPKAAPLRTSNTLSKAPPRTNPPRTRTTSHQHPLHSLWSPDPVASVTPPPRPSEPKPRPPYVGPSAPPSTPEANPSPPTSTPATVSALLRRVAELESQNLSLQRQHRAPESDTGARLEAKTAVDKAALQTLQSENTQLKADTRRLRAQRDALTASASASVAALGEMKGKVAALEAERRQWRNDSDELRGTVTRLEGKLAKLRVIRESMGVEVDRVLNGDNVVKGDNKRR